MLFRVHYYEKFEKNPGVDFHLKISIPMKNKISY